MFKTLIDPLFDSCQAEVAAFISGPARFMRLKADLPTVEDGSQIHVTLTKVEPSRPLSDTDAASGGSLALEAEQTLDDVPLCFVGTAQFASEASDDPRRLFVVGTGEDVSIRAADGKRTLSREDRARIVRDAAALDRWGIYPRSLLNAAQSPEPASSFFRLISENAASRPTLCALCEPGAERWVTHDPRKGDFDGLGDPREQALRALRSDRLDASYRDAATRFWYAVNVLLASWGRASPVSAVWRKLRDLADRPLLSHSPEYIYARQFRRLLEPG